MRILQVLHRNRPPLLLGSCFLCLLGFVAGCDSGSSTATLNPEANKAREKSEGDARRAAFGQTGNPTSKLAKGLPRK